MNNIDDNSIALAHQVFSTHAKSFRLASLFLPKNSIDDIAVLYALCRLIDDSVDEAPNQEVAQENILQLHSELVGNKEPRAEIQHFFRLQEKWGLQRRDLLDLMQGMITDLGPVRIQSDQQLAQYCYQVAGVVGRMMSPLLGVQSPKAVPFAIDLGLAMQITNICRDVLEDGHRDRIYLPASRLEKQGIDGDALIRKEVSPEKLSLVVQELLDIADIHYERAYIGTQFIPWRSRLGILIALRVYRAIGIKLRNKHQSNPLHGRTIVSPLGKVWNIALAGIDFFRTVVWRLKIQQSPQPILYQSPEDLLTEVHLC